MKTIFQKTVTKIILLLAVLFFILLFPLLLNIVIRCAIKVTTYLNFPEIIYLSELSDIRFSDYVSAIISLFSCVSALWIGYITYRLSRSITEYTQRQDTESLQYAALTILIEIEHNINILENYIKFIEHAPEKIRFDAYKSLEKISSKLTKNTISNIHSLYEMFRMYQEKQTISGPEKERWFAEDNSFKNNILLETLSKLGGIT